MGLPKNSPVPRSLLALALALVPAFGGCDKGPPPDDTAALASLAAKPKPKTAAEAEALKTKGTSWSNEEVRLYYNELVAAIGPANEGWKKEGLSVEERARRAYTMRHDARITTRAMMASRDEVEQLQKRDLDKYGSPDGPTFEWLVKSNEKKGAEGDALYEKIIESAQRTDPRTNAALGISGN